MSAYTLAVDFLPLLGGMVVAVLVYRTLGRTRRLARSDDGRLSARRASGVLLTDAVISPHAGTHARSAGRWVSPASALASSSCPSTPPPSSSIPAANSGIAASTINTSRELGAVTGVAILGSIVNGQLTVNLTHRLIQIGVPPSFRQEIIDGRRSRDRQLQGRRRERQAAAPPFAHHQRGRSRRLRRVHPRPQPRPLTVSGLLLLVSGGIAYFTGTAERRPS